MICAQLAEKLTRCAPRLPSRRSECALIRNWRFLLQAALSTALLLLLLRALDWGRLGALLVRVDRPTALAASAFVPILIGLLALRLRLFVRGQGIPISRRRALAITWAGQFFNSILPGSTGGDVLKVYELCRLAPDRKAAAAVAVIVDRLSALAALAVLGAIGICIAVRTGLRFPPELERWLAEWWWVVACGVLASGLGLLAVLRSAFFRDRLRQVRDSLRRAATPGPALVGAIVLAFAIHALSVGSFWLFARALGLSLTYPQALAIVPTVMILLLLPVTVNGHGLRELLLISCFGAFQVTLADGSRAAVRDVVLALSVLLVSNDLLWCLPGGFAYLWVRYQPADS